MKPPAAHPHAIADSHVDALHWFVRRRDPTWLASDEAEFLDWLDTHADNAPAYAQAQAQWVELDAMPPDLLEHLRRNLAPSQASAAEPPRAQAHGRSTKRPTRRGWLAASALAAVAVLAVGGAGLAGWQYLQAGPVYLQAFSTVRGQQLTVPLPDGTRVRLDTATQLQVTYYQQRREVRLDSGQAVFEVQPGVRRPFHVLAGATRVTVAGTRFSVRYTPDMPGDAGVQVAVEEGRVRVASQPAITPDLSQIDLQSGVLLTAGQQVITDAHGNVGPVSSVPLAGIAPWRGQRVSFVDVPLAQALAEIERYRSTGLVVRDPTVAALRLSGTFDPMAADALHKALPRVLPVRLQRRAGQTEIVSVP